MLPRAEISVTPMMERCTRTKGAEPQAPSILQRGGSGRFRTEERAFGTGTGAFGRRTRPCCERGRSLRGGGVRCDTRSGRLIAATARWRGVRASSYRMRAEAPGLQAVDARQSASDDTR